MKKLIVLFILLVVACLALSSCTAVEDVLKRDSNEAISDRMFTSIVKAIDERDATSLATVFVESIRLSVDDFETQTASLISFVEGDIVSYTNAVDGGVVVESIFEQGKRQTYLQPSFTLVTTEQTYHIAIKLCSHDYRGEVYEGVTSLYIVSAVDWVEPYVYRGGDEFAPGIHIQVSGSALFEETFSLTEENMQWAIENFPSDKQVGAVDTADVAINQAKKLWQEEHVADVVCWDVFCDLWADYTGDPKEQVLTSFDEENACWLVYGAPPNDPDLLCTVPMTLIKTDGDVLAVWLG